MKPVIPNNAVAAAAPMNHTIVNKNAAAKSYPPITLLLKRPCKTQHQSPPESPDQTHRNTEAPSYTLPRPE